VAARYVGNEKDGFVEIGVPHSYKIGDVVFWATASGAGEYTFIGHPKSDKAGKVLVLALGAEIGFGVDAHECAPGESSLVDGVCSARQLSEERCPSSFAAIERGLCDCAML
jgi:hypothetical protein